MFKKFNWGHGITLFYLVFVGVVVTALIASFGVKDSLVQENYYAQDLAYQSTYDKMVNSLERNSVQTKYDPLKKEVRVLFEEGKSVAGNIKFYRPSDDVYDFNTTINNTTMVIPTGELMKGKWKLKIDWTEDGTPYYTEEIIYL